jgi:hypothetical protein
MNVHEKIDAGVYASKLPCGTSVKGYLEDENRLPLQFRNDLLEELGVTTNPKAGAAYKLAWGYGEGYGLHRVYDHFRNIFELIK